MSGVKFTPGPWVADDGDGYSAWTVWAGCSPTGHGPTGQLIAQVVGDGQNEWNNAPLIAAAPDLYKALSQLIQHVDENEGDTIFAVVQDAKAAIAKARGESA